MSTGAPARPPAAHLVVDDLAAPDLGRPDAHHLSSVLRLRRGEVVSATDGRGGLRLFTWRGDGQVEAAGDPEWEERPHPLVTVGFSPVKGDRPQWALQKLTELRVDRVLLLQADRSVVRWDPDRRSGHLERYRRVARAAVMQSRARWLPELDFADFADFAGPAGDPDAVSGLAMASPGASGRPSLERPTVLVGPEGGWSDDEEATGLAKVSLGPGVLRSETAAVAVGVLLCALRARAGVPSMTGGDQMFGVYVHVPFCTRRCDYCAFATWTDRFHLVDGYLAACASDIHRSVSSGMPRAGSVFFGGGTPSLLDGEQIDMVLQSIPMSSGAEVTVECNPDTVDLAKLTAYRSAGVTRLSFGVQSMVPGVLAALGRSHDPAAVSRAVEAAGRAGYEDRYSVDLIFGAVGETRDDWERTLAAVMGLEPAPAHVSAYALTVEAGTPLARDRGRHPDPDDQAEKYEMADELLTSAGLRWYEISNWARPGSECAHNRLYWSQGEYLGFGCAAHSHRVDPDGRTARRWWNLRTPERYVRAIATGGSGFASGEDLGASVRALERLELAIRTREGVPEAALAGWRDAPDLAGLVEPTGAGRLALTLRGRLLANEVALRLEA